MHAAVRAEEKTDNPVVTGEVSRRALICAGLLAASSVNLSMAAGVQRDPRAVQLAAECLADAMRATYGGRWVVNIDERAGFAVVRRDYSSVRSDKTYSA